jgi:hypothetical protein
LFAVALSAPGVANAQSGTGHPFSWAQFGIGMLALAAGFELFLYFLLLRWVVEVAVGPNWVRFRRYGHRWRTVSDVSRVEVLNRRGTLGVGDGWHPGVALGSAALADGVAAALLSQFGTVVTPEARRILEDHSGKQPVPLPASLSLKATEPRQQSLTLPQSPWPAPTAQPCETEETAPRIIPPTQAERLQEPKRRFWPAGMGARQMVLWQMVTLLMGGGLVAAGLLQANGTWPFVTGLIILSMCLFLALAMGAISLAPVSLAHGQLRWRTFWWRRRSYPVEGISGLAMVWSRRGSWTASLWDSDGRLHLLLSITASGGSGTQLERTRGGKTLSALYEAIEDAQGPNGALRTRALQREDAQRDAIWDPTTGRTWLGAGT